MSEHDHVDRLLAQALSAPVPALSPEFNRQLAARLRRRQVGPRGRLVLGSYAGLALLLCIWVMRQASVEWSLVAAATLVPLTGLALVLVRGWWVCHRPISTP